MFLRRILLPNAHVCRLGRGVRGPALRAAASGRMGSLSLLFPKRNGGGAGDMLRAFSDGANDDGGDSQPKLVTLDTYQLVKSLRTRGFTIEQAEAIMECIRSGLQSAHDVQIGLSTSKQEVREIETKLKEDVFNAQLKFDLQHKHQRELSDSRLTHLQDDLRSLVKTVEADMKSLRSELSLHQKVEISQLAREVLGLEKLIASRHGEYQHSIEQMENRLTKGAVGVLISLVGIGLGFMRIFM
mmetsp:Transcript_10818/g.19751  ORF Transcript_10818/g.19751 Transcript_10818/m.19751 type:complete len:242 (-) Transcript_10818:99-824(-)|eukprot:CAMPEP_0197529774 /NCGR_PEP_ID=MMETSP1318-20131121/29610_1 /TAXON_ID=552666 /ORGANISM="Partenskyella glossopodia, Strain RCC365" /LENGTH=241 /DNA_ID=CAMNT_0043085371 /DNA_START=1 /DNA_END=726 /DNA_ORIENTATION=-